LIGKKGEGEVEVGVGVEVVRKRNEAVRDAGSGSRGEFPEVFKPNQG
jgi:hypothetical protein